MDEFDLKSTPERRILDLRVLGIRDVPVIGHYTYRRAAQGLQRETHSEHFEVTFLTKGVQIYETEGERTVLRGGDLYLTRPGESHSTAGQPEEKGEAYWIFIRAVPGGSFLRFDAEAVSAFRSIFETGRRSARASAELQEHLNKLFELHETHQSNPLAKAALMARVDLLVLELAACFTREVKDDIGGAVGRVLERLKRDDQWDVSIAELAQEARLSEARFKVRFKQEVGIPPGEYLMRRRIEKAKLWLRKTQYRIADIAKELAFPTSQYFATVFKRYTGKTPQDWRVPKKGDP
ncbi:MAG: AraC family transcriptional regulator [Verrucomicrobiales bacterium]|nr:AraC family transcriptional regulator [Verrucomicrobiales bacterium]